MAVGLQVKQITVAECPNESRLNLLFKPEAATVNYNFS